jgi:hypothetical protein
MTPVIRNIQFFTFFGGDKLYYFCVHIEISVRLRIEREITNTTTTTTTTTTVD